MHYFHAIYSPIQRCSGIVHKVNSIDLMTRIEKRRGILLFLALLWCGSVALTAFAAPTISLDRTAQEISDTVMSPYCPGRTLSACPSEEARKLRENVSDWLAEGQSEEQVRGRLVTEFGGEILGAPGGEGFGLLAWTAPIIFVIILGAIFILSLKHGLRKPTVEILQENISPVSANELAESAELDEAIRKRLV